MDLLYRLCNAAGIPGREGPVQRIVKDAFAEFCDEVREDRLGNVIGLRRARAHHDGAAAPSIMIAAHMDEIGFVVSSIDERGFVRFVPVGGFDPSTLLAQRVQIHTEDGPLLGVIGVKPIHMMNDRDRDRRLKIDDLFIDLGPAPEGGHRPLEVGDPITLHRALAPIGDGWTGKSIDDRVGVFTMIEAGRRLDDETSPFDIYFVATVQEEVGARGAGVSAFGIDPDVGIAIDVTVASDVPGFKDHEFVTAVGGGTAIKILDGGSIADPSLVRHLRSLARDRGIAYQMEVLPKGGTDAGPIQRAGSGRPVATLSIPTRYLHTTVELIARRDVDATVALLALALETPLPTHN